MNRVNSNQINQQRCNTTPAMQCCINVQQLRSNNWSFSFQSQLSSSLWPPYGIGQATIFLPCGFFLLLLSFYLFLSSTCPNKARIDNRKKKLAKQQYLLHMSLQYGELRPTNGWDPFVSLGHPGKFQWVSHLGSVTARHLVVGISQTLRRWTEGATDIRQGGHHVGHRPTF